MAYDEQLADRVRELVQEHGPADEKRMFGGLAFLLGGHLAVCASHDGGLLVRTDGAWVDRGVATARSLPPKASHGRADGTPLSLSGASTMSMRVICSPSTVNDTTECSRPSTLKVRPVRPLISTIST